MKKRFFFINITMFLGLCFIGAFVLVKPTRAATTFTVNSTVDAVDANPGNGICATASNVCTLRAAIQEANVLAGDDTINLPTGTYTLTIAGANEDSGLTGDLDITSNLTLSGASASNTFINGNGLDTVLNVSGTVTVAIANVTIQNGNGSFLGGGIVNVAGTLTLLNTTVRNNTAYGAGGIFSGGILTLLNSTVRNNIASGGGAGGIYSCTSVTLTQSAIISNTASTGGGGGLYNCGGPLTLVNSTVSGNSTRGKGGGIFSDGVGPVGVRLNNTTITGNIADSDSDNIFSDTGGGVNSALSAVVTLTNTLIAGNLDGQGRDCSGTLTSQGYNLLGKNTGCGFVATTGDQVGTGVSPINPQLGPLQDNGGPTLTHALLTGSPAIDAGYNASCAATDQRGLFRPADGDNNTIATCDIGAFELGGLILNHWLYVPIIQRGP